MAMLEGSIRSFLLAEVGHFVFRARDIPGVRRIALVGSLITAKANPKDADLLIWVDDDADLSPLARVGRQLQGAVQARNHGADLFLADANDHYLGRICRYRDCRPGIRMSCNALHCGRRPRVCDDFHRLSLPAGLIKAPPLELWPTIIRRRIFPNDVEEWIVAMEGAAGSRDAL